MTQIVQRQRWECRVNILATADSLNEPPRRAVWPEGVCEAVAEYKRGSLTPVHFQVKFISQEPRQGHTSCLVPLWCAHYDHSSNLDRILFDTGAPTREVDAVYSEPDSLAPPKARVGEQMDESAVFACLFCESLYLFKVEVGMGLIQLAWQGNATCRVDPQAPILYGVVEDTREHAMSPLDYGCTLTLPCSEFRDPRLNLCVTDGTDATLAPTWLDVNAQSDFEGVERRWFHVRAIRQPVASEFTNGDSGRRGVNVLTRAHVDFDLGEKALCVTLRSEATALL